MEADWDYLAYWTLCFGSLLHFRGRAANVFLGMRFQLVKATVCRKAIAWEKCSSTKGIGKDSRGSQAITDGNAGYLAQLTAQSPV